MQFQVLQIPVELNAKVLSFTIGAETAHVALQKVFGDKLNRSLSARGSGRKAIFGTLEDETEVIAKEPSYPVACSMFYDPKLPPNDLTTLLVAMVGKYQRPDLNMTLHIQPASEDS